jgi:hypothetical protein
MRGAPGDPSRHAATAMSNATRTFKRICSSAEWVWLMTPLPRGGPGAAKGTEGCDATPAGAGCQRERVGGAGLQSTSRAMSW